MCVHRRTMNDEPNEAGLKGGASCSHRVKKSLFKAKEMRKKLKAGKYSECEECKRLIDKGQTAPETESGEILMCASCASPACIEHAIRHCEAIRTGDPHPFLYSVTKGTVRCHPCDVDLEPLEDPSDPVKNFVNDCKSFVKIQAAQAETKKEAKDVKVAEDPVQPVPSDAATKPLVKEDVDERKPTRRSGSLKTSVSTPNGFASGETMIPAKGLSNLGNTCFFNSVMQCIMHTHHLQYYFEKFGRVKELHYTEAKTVTVNEEKIELKAAVMPVPEEDCPLNDVVRGFIAEFRCNTSPSPSSVFAQISKKAPRFKGWQQQDAHELLRYLLDGLRSEETERYRTAIASHFGVSKTANRKKVDPEIVKACKGYLNEAGRPLLDAVFGGTLLQTIRCAECGHISERMEQFLDLSIPMSANPMSARLAGGQNSRQPSAHQKKKAEKLAKKANRRQARQSAAKKSENDDVAAAADAVEEMQLSESELSEDVEEEEEDDDENEETRTTAGLDRIDMTKVLVPAPVEYQRERNVGACLLEFTAEELLAGSNAYECEGCCVPRNKKLDAKGAQKKRVDAVKRYLIYEPPAILTLQLKRFQQIAGVTGRLSTRKLGGHVDFPLIFDIAPFCCKNVDRVAAGQKNIFYSLYGVVVHSGDLSGGHYIAYVKSRHRVHNAVQYLEAARASCVDTMFSTPAVDLSKVANVEAESTDGQWYYCSDSRVMAVAESRVLAAEAYILFYERL